MSVEDGSSHSQASLKAASVVEAYTVSKTKSCVSTHINYDAGAVLLFIVLESLDSRC